MKYIILSIYNLDFSTIMTKNNACVVSCTIKIQFHDQVQRENEQKSTASSSLSELFIALHSCPSSFISSQADVTTHTTVRLDATRHYE